MFLETLEEERRKYVTLLENIDSIINNLLKNKNDIEDSINQINKNILIDNDSFIGTQMDNSIDKINTIIKHLKDIIIPSINTKITFIDSQIEVFSRI